MNNRQERRLSIQTGEKIKLILGVKINHYKTKKVINN